MILSLGLALPVHAEGLAITDVSSRVVNDIHVVDATVEYGLSEDMRNALDNGIALDFLLEVEIQRPRRYLWDALVLRSVQRLRLEYHALSGSYVVRNEATHRRWNFTALDEALGEMGKVSDVAISETRYLPANGSYTGRMRVSLDVESLPPPMRLIAYFSPQWHLSSSWRQWTLQP